jgi:hypothetical protein
LGFRTAKVIQVFFANRALCLKSIESLKDYGMTTIDANYKGKQLTQGVKSKPRMSISPISLGLLAGIFAVLFTPIIINMINSGNDYPAHISWAFLLDKTGMVPDPLPHFLYQVVVILAEHLLPGNSYDLAATFVGIVCYVSLGLIIFFLIRPLIIAGPMRLRTLSAVLITLVLMLVGPINVLTWGNHNLSSGYISPHSYHNPTVILLQPFALLLFLYAIRVFESAETTRATIIVCALVTFLGTIAKPNYTIAVIPAISALVFYALVRKQKVNWPLLIIGIALPAAEVLIWQLNYVRGTSLSGFVFAPLAVMSAYSPDNLLLKFVLSILFPLIVTALYWRSALKNIGMKLAWLTFGVGAFYTYFLAESHSFSYGNFTWSGQISLFILFVATMLFLLQQNEESFKERRLNRRFVLSITVLLLHLIGGILLYLPHLGVDWHQWL